MKTYFFSLFLLCGLLVKAQDFSFSQFYENPLLRNPALAGIFEGDIRVSGAFRNQWQSVTVPYRTGAASAEYKFRVLRTDYLTLGLQTTYDEAGDVKLKKTAILPALNGHILLFKNGTYLQVGVMGGPVSNQFDPNLAKYGDQFVNGSYDPANPTQQQFSRTGMNYMDLNAGVSINGNIDEDLHYYAGVGYYHAAPNEHVAFYTNNTKVLLSPKLALTTGFKKKGDYNSFEMFGDYYVQGGHRQVIIGGLYGTLLNEVTDNLNNQIYFYAGGLYRYNDALIPVIKFDIYQFGIGLSYDINISKLTVASSSRGGFELSLNYKLNLTGSSPDERQVECPAPGKGF